MRAPVAVWNRSRPSQDNEILLPPGTEFRVVRRHAEGGLRYITMQHVTARDIAAEHAQLSPASRWQRFKQGWDFVWNGTMPTMEAARTQTAA